MMAPAAPQNVFVDIRTRDPGAQAERPQGQLEPGGAGADRDTARRHPT